MKAMNYVCTKCGYDIGSNKKFCIRCGENVIESQVDAYIFCEKCGQKNTKKSGYCNSCGTPIASQSVSSHNKQEYRSSQVLTKAAPPTYAGVFSTCIGTVLAIAGIMGFNYFRDFLRNPFRLHFVFGGCGQTIFGRVCTACDAMTSVFWMSSIALIIGVILGVFGINKIIKSKR